MNRQPLLPELHLPDWKETKDTLHRYAQIVGKIRMKLTPFQNHWWHVPLYVTSHGLSTRLIPYEKNPLEIQFDFIDHRLSVSSAKSPVKSFALHDGLSVAEFYGTLFSFMNKLEIPVEILAKPYELSPDTPFADDWWHHHYDENYIERFHEILLWVNQQFRNFNRSFYGKVCPIQLYWHSFDLATTRFSGNRAPEMPEAGPVDREAYSHEVISFGFWPGDENIPDATFYSYTFPAPEGVMDTQLEPTSARWTEQRDSPMALLMYEDVQTAADPASTLQAFLKSAYKTGAALAGWDTEKLEKVQDKIS